MKKKKIKFWWGYRKQAAEHFCVSVYLIDYWWKTSKPELVNWLFEEKRKRDEEQLKANYIKHQIEKV